MHILHTYLPIVFKIINDFCLQYELYTYEEPCIQFSVLNIKIEHFITF